MPRERLVLKDILNSPIPVFPVVRTRPVAGGPGLRSLPISVGGSAPITRLEHALCFTKPALRGRNPSFILDTDAHCAKSLLELILETGIGIFW